MGFGDIQQRVQGRARPWRSWAAVCTLAAMAWAVGPVMADEPARTEPKTDTKTDAKAAEVRAEPAPVATAPKPELPAAKPLIIRYFGDINADTANQFVEGIDQALLKGGVSEIVVLLSSGGGDMYSAIGLYNYLKGIRLPIKVYNMGMVGSAATIIYSAGSERYTSAFSQFLLHSSSVGSGPSVGATKLLELHRMARALDKQMIDILAATSGQSPKVIEELIATGATLSPDEAVRLGLAHKQADWQYSPANNIFRAPYRFSK